MTVLKGWGRDEDRVSPASKDLLAPPMGKGVSPSKTEEMKRVRTLESWQGAKATVTGYSVLGREQESPRPGGTDHIRGDSGRRKGVESAI